MDTSTGSYVEPYARRKPENKQRCSVSTGAHRDAAVRPRRSTGG
jgi:hypothetical protein